ncbi:MAG: 4-hydroxythreonine-4-phosphate dehydrogenase PdxA [Candidatus Omnitrophica bacterium]|nr:4-hydroxythreonine-4-phosphate dehydrogenase PdxA [Candidatus Omnitrophota bacterium]
MYKTRIRVGITMGDPSGIGPAIIAKALPEVSHLAEFIIIGDKWVFDKASGCRIQASGIKFIDLNNVSHKNFVFGRVKAEYGRASIEYLDQALELIKKKEIDCLVTCPISKDAINKAGFHFLGHTEYLARQTNTKAYLMMLLNKSLKFSLVTRHIPLEDVAASLNKDNISRAILFTYKALKELFLIRDPRIVVCGLNPHASDCGLIGSQENNVIKPALYALRKNIKVLDGPMSSDAAILKAKQGKYDGVIAMYHDQALIPLKLSGGLSGVNMTLGLPFIRTSPLHGTAFDIATKPALASPDSLLEAIRLVVKCRLNLKSH